ncbi:MAG: hypothetical protein KAY82_01595 [Hylemonella sp.]|nr:hypothetical protein [Hylemonella sp.]
MNHATTQLTSTSMRKRQNHLTALRPTAVVAAMRMLQGMAFLTWCSTASSSPIPLAQQPAGTGGREPAPNVIMSIDDSGSMGGAVGGGNNASKMSVLKTALISQFGNPTANPPTKGKLEDGRIRLAWQSMCRNPTQIVPGSTNSMKSFEGQHRTNFYNYITDLTPNCGTPSHRLMKQALDYMKTAQGTNSPWADVPGTSQSTPYMACRRTYNIFLTDGGWNSDNNQSEGNADGVTRTLGDGSTVYDVTSDQTRIYRDSWGGPAMNQLSTLADLTFAAWATDLQDGNNGTANMANTIQPLIRKSGTETVGATVLQEFWNPKNDPATWQHMVTHTIGFGQGAYRWTNNSGNTLIAPLWDNATDNNYGGDYSNIVNGTVNWPNPITGMNENGRPFELWHMALNSRGKFYPARDANALSNAFADILDNVINDTSKPLVSIAASASSIRPSTLMYSAGYDGTDWSGYLKAYKVSSSGPSTTPEWNSATLLDAADPATRVVLSHDGASGIPFRWASLPSAAPATLRTLLDSTDSRGSDRVSYLRGVRTTEGLNVTDFRKRNTILGDVVNSNMWYLGPPSSALRLPGYATFASTGAVATRSPMIYIGANDGMLHGISAAANASDAGKERVAYVPLGAYPNLYKLTSQSYAHLSFVDGSPFSGDVLISTSPTTWKTYLAGFMGAGGKGYFILDVTNPSAFAESNASSLVVLDNTLPADADIGYMFTQPGKNPANPAHAVQFVMMNNSRPALILGNGVNSANERPVLLVQYLDGAKEVFKLVASSTTGQSNGLMNPQVIDLNSDGKADVVYAGDLQGNLWKFDISASTSAGWKVSFGGNPLFMAKDTGNSPQSIVAAPVWVPHPKGGVMLGFVTGRNFTTGDRTDVSEQSIYAVWDNSVITIASSGALSIADDATKRITNGRTSLVQQTINSTVISSFAGRVFYNSSSNPVNYTSSGANPNKRGWYMNFLDSGERGTNNPTWSSAGGDYADFFSSIPAQGTDSNTETCSLTSKAEVPFVTTVSLINGAPPLKPYYDNNGGGFNYTEVITSRVKGQGKSVTFKNTDTSGTSTSYTGTNSTGLGIKPKLDGGITTGWRER